MIHLTCRKCPFEILMGVDLFLKYPPSICKCGEGLYIGVVKVEVSE